MTLSKTFPALLVLSSALKAGGLEDLATVRPETTSHRASSYDRSGGNEDNITSFAPRTSVVLLDADGPGRVNHLWLTISTFPNHPTYLRDLVLRMTWENAPVPSVEVPLGDFFALGHSRSYAFASAALAVGINDKALNCYWPMPFYRHARIEIYNNGRRSIRRLYYHVNYELGTQAPNQGLFHAVYRSETNLRTQAHTANTTGRDNYVILETEGCGHYVGCALFIDAQPGGWWGEGDDMIFVDHSETPVLIGTGSEDYFNNAWGYTTPFSYPFYGCPLLERRPDGGSLTTVYRWHIPDPVRFQEHLRVTIEHIYSDRVANDYSSVAYWYQLEPITRRSPLPYAEKNHPKLHRTVEPPPARLEIHGTELEPELLRRGVAARGITAGLGDGYRSGGWLRIEQMTSPLEIVLPVPADGHYRVGLKPVNHVLDALLKAGLRGGPMQTFQKRAGSEGRVPYLDLGTAKSQDRAIRLVLEGGPVVGIDHIRLENIAAATLPAPALQRAPQDAEGAR